MSSWAAPLKQFCDSRLVDAHKYLASCAIGLSGAIFGLIVVDNACSNAQTRSIFGMFTVPAKWYPWALLVFWQLLMPGVSFLGHLGGVLAGQAYVWGWLRWLTLSAAAYQVMSPSYDAELGGTKTALKQPWEAKCRPTDCILKTT